MTTTPYTSPIPVRRAHLGDAIASEWTKMRSLRSTVWTLGALGALVAGPGVLLAVLLDETPRTRPKAASPSPVSACSGCCSPRCA